MSLARNKKISRIHTGNKKTPQYITGNNGELHMTSPLSALLHQKIKHKKKQKHMKSIAIGTLIALGGGILRILMSIQNKEDKRPGEHLVTLAIVVVVGFSISYILHRAEVDHHWYSTGVLFVLGYGYDKFLKILSTNVPHWINKIFKVYLEKKYSVDLDNNKKENERDE